MKTATAQISRITTRLNGGTARISIHAPSPQRPDARPHPRPRPAHGTPLPLAVRPIRSPRPANQKGPIMTLETTSKPDNACLRVCLWCGDAVAKKNAFYNHNEQPICWLCLAEAILNDQVTRTGDD